MTSNKRIMGAAFTNRPIVAALAWAIAAVVCHASGSLVLLLTLLLLLSHCCCGADGRKFAYSGTMPWAYT